MIRCSTCGHQNSEDIVLCEGCGSKLGATHLSGGLNTGNANATSSSSQSHSGYQQLPASYHAQTPAGYQQSAAQIQATAQPQSGTQPKFSSPPAQMGTRANAVIGESVPHAFAGKGSSTTHYSWILYGESPNAENLRSAILKIASLRRFLNLKISTEKLRESGHWTEEREYIVFQRGVANLLVYVAPTGQDLYISRATMVQLSYDPARIFILVAAICAIFVLPFVAFTSASGAFYAFSALIGLVIAVTFIPSLLTLLLFVGASLKHWSEEKTDFWIYLRRNYLRDFEIDDVKLLEQAIDEAVHVAGEQLKVDVTKLNPPAQGYETKRRVRII